MNHLPNKFYLSRSSVYSFMMLHWVNQIYYFSQRSTNWILTDVPHVLIFRVCNSQLTLMISFSNPGIYWILYVLMLGFSALNHNRVLERKVCESSRLWEWNAQIPMCSEWGNSPVSGEWELRRDSNQENTSKSKLSTWNLATCPFSNKF